MPSSPGTDGRSLVSLVSELERRARGDAPTPGLDPDLAATVPPGRSTVFVLFDGMGHDVVASRPEADPLRMALRGRLLAPFSSQTSVATATIATGVHPVTHGLIGYLLRLPRTGTVVNTLWWFDGAGPVDVDLGTFLPVPNVSERLAGAGWSTAVVEPAGFLGSPLDRVLYRNARTYGVTTDDELVQRTVELAIEPGTFVVAYVPHVDAAGHAEGPGSDAHRVAVDMASTIWDELSGRLPPHVTLVGTADHGMVGVDDRITIEPPDVVQLGGDNRVVFLWGDPAACRGFAEALPGRWIDAVDATGWWGAGPVHPEFHARRPEGLLIAPERTVFHHPGSPTPLAGYHGGLTAAELGIPLLVR